MKKKAMVMMCFLWLVMPVFSFAGEMRGPPNPNVSAYTHANENAKFKRNGDVFNNKANTKIRDKKLTKKEAAEIEKKAEEAQDKGKGQVKVKF